MNTALPIMVVNGDRWAAACNITGGAIRRAILSVAVDLKKDYKLSELDNNYEILNEEDVGVFVGGTDDVTIAPDPTGERECVINHVVNILNIAATSNTVGFALPGALTDCIKPGKYSYNISVVDVDHSEYITPVYTNAFNVFARVNAINLTQSNS